MKRQIQTILTSRVALMTTLGCVLTFGIIIFMLKGCSGYKDMSNLIHPYLSEKELKSNDPIKVDPFPEPSLDRLVSHLKSELGITEAEVAPQTAEMIAKERAADNLNYMDSRKDANTRQNDFDRRKRQVIANPELLWTPGFILPPTLDVSELNMNALYDYKIKYDEEIKLSKSQEERTDNLRDQSQKDEITSLERTRGKAAILAENYPPLTIAKLYLRSSTGSDKSKVGMEYAEMAIRENPDSFEAHHVWALCNRMYYLGTDDEKVIAGFRQLVERFPNSSIAHYDLAWNLEVHPVYPIELGVVRHHPYAEEALGAIQRAIQLDDRIARNNATLGNCYVVMGEYEKALAVYQGMPQVYYGHAGGLTYDIYKVQEAVSKLRQQEGQ